MRYSLALFLVFLTLSKGESKCYSRGSCKGDKEDVLAGIASFLDCHKTCRGREECQWFTHNEATKTCFLFSNCPDIDENCLNCVTSEKMCPYFPGKLCFKSYFGIVHWTDLATAPGEPNKLLVIGGNWNDSTLADTTEVFDLDDPMAKCKVVEFNPARSCKLPSFLTWLQIQSQDKRFSWCHWRIDLWNRHCHLRWLSRIHWRLF